MDPFSVATGALSIADIAFRVGGEIVKFARAARHVDKTLEELADEVKALGNICKAISEIDFVEPASVVSINPQLLRCQEILVKLDTALPTMPADISFLTKPALQFKLNLRQGDIDEYRQQIAHSTWNLQLGLQLLSLKATYIAPQLANAALFEEIKKIARLLSSRNYNSFDRTLVEYADEVMSEGRSLYAQSEAPASVVGVSSALKRMVMSDWIDTIVTLRHDAEAGASSQSAFSEPSYESYRPRASTPATSDGNAAAVASEPRTGDDDENSDHRLAIDLTNLAFAEGDRLFRSGDFAQAENMLQEGLQHLQTLPEHLRRTYNLQDTHFQLAVCIFNLHNLESAENALLSIMGQQSVSDAAAVQQLRASLLLAQVYVKQGRLDMAVGAAKRVYSSPRSILSRDPELRLGSIALLYQTTLLSASPSKAALYAGLLPAELREKYCQMYSDLRVIGTSEDVHQNSPAESATTSDRDDLAHPKEKPASVPTMEPSAAPTLDPALDRSPTPRTDLTSMTTSTALQPIRNNIAPVETSAGWYGIIPPDLAICRYSDSGVLVAAGSRASHKGNTTHYLGVLEARLGAWEWMRQYKIDALPTSLGVSPSGKICVWAYKSNMAFIQSLDTGKIIHRLTFWVKDLRSVVFTATEEAVLTIHDHKVRAWHVRSGKMLWTYTPGIWSQDDISNHFRLSSDNSLAMIAESKHPGLDIHVVDCNTGRLKTAWTLKRARVRSIFWSRNNTTLAVIFDDLTEAHIYNLNGKIQRTVVVTHSQNQPHNNNRSTSAARELSWTFLDNDLILTVLLRQTTKLLAVFDFSLRKWWYIPLSTKELQAMQNADETKKRSSLAPLLFRAADDQRILMDQGAVIRHCRAHQDRREIVRYEKQYQVPIIDDSEVAWE